AAEGNRLTDIDGNTVADFCLGDTGAMFGHVPPPIAQALADRRGRGLTHMLPSDDAEAVGALLASRFGLPHWQVAATASDANRFALRVARAVTGRRVVVVFDGCYHGAVDETLVDLVDGATVSRPSLLGPAFDAAATTRAVPFNDPEALARALAPGDVACVIAEPVMTNCSMILPRPGFHAELRDATRRHGTLLILDETHTISTGPGGYTGRHRLEPDILVAGKPVAGGVPASVWGFTDAVAARLAAVNAGRPPGHSGIGTTLSGSAFALAMLRACLESVATPEAYALMEARAAMIADGLTALIRRRGLPWHVARVGARLEVVFRAEPLADAAQARAAAAPALERTIHLGLLNRGYLATPFHNMLLVSPQTSDADAEGLVAAYDSLVGLLLGEGAP
ncbi:MAG TPA: transaminase, partial [Alphaproteobacteria bacterium]|nr:transaminase [Alphaproteobacteria bacterium]